MKEFFKRHKEIIFLGGLFFLVFLSHFFFEIHIYDDVFFQKIPMNGLFPFLKSRYFEWSSRLLIEMVLVTFLHLPDVLWYFVNSLMILLIGYSICKLFRVEQFQGKVLIYTLLFLYPMYQMSGAGWYATSINYLWPFACGLFSMIPIRKVLDGEKIKISFYPLYVISLLFACNQEQMCAIVFSFYLLFVLYFVMKDKNHTFLWVLFFLSICSLFFILTCPGNGARSIQETATWYPEFQNFNFMQKLALGLLSTVSFTIFNLKLPFLVLSCMLFFLLYRHKNVFVRLNAFFPVFVLGVFQFFPNVSSELFSFLSIFSSSMQKYMTKVISVPFDFSFLLCFLFSVFLILSLVISIYFVLREDKGKAKYFIPLIYLAGVASRCILGFSSTLYDSGERTFLFYHFGMILCIMYFGIFKSQKKNVSLYLILGVVLVMLQLVNTMILV